MITIFTYSLLCYIFVELIHFFSYLIEPVDSTFDKKHDLARLLELVNHVAEGLGADDLGVLGLVPQKVVNLLDGAVERANGEPVVVHVQDQVLAHDCQSDQRQISPLKIPSHFL